MIPDWLKETDPCPPRRFDMKRGRKSFIGKTLGDMFSFFGETLTSENYSRRNGLLQGLDPRVKLASILALVVAVTMIKDLYLLIFVYALTLLFAGLSKISIGFFVKRVWLFIPIFTGIIVLPVIFNVVTPGDLLVPLVAFGPNASIGGILLPETFGITVQGLLTAVTFTIRVATCVSAIVLLFLSTPQESLFKAFRALGVPKVYVLTLDMCYRYIFMFIDIIRDMFVAKKSRTIRSEGTFAEQKWVTGRIGYTLIKTLDMSDKVHKAMVSRGFTGDVKIMQEYRMKKRDYIALVTVFGFSIFLIMLSYNIIKV